jgi:hypothetical protein
MRPTQLGVPIVISPRRDPPSLVVNSEEEVAPLPNQNVGQGKKRSDFTRIPVATLVVRL